MKRLSAVCSIILTIAIWCGALYSGGVQAGNLCEVRNHDLWCPRDWEDNVTVFYGDPGEDADRYSPEEDGDVFIILEETPRDVFSIITDDYWALPEPLHAVTFSYADQSDAVVFEKGKITINGESFTDNRQIYEKLAELIGIHHGAMCEDRNQ